jgi:hypothetical protein
MHIVHRHDGDYDLDNQADVDKIVAQMHQAIEEGRAIDVTPEPIKQLRREAFASYKKKYGLEHVESEEQARLFGLEFLALKKRKAAYPLPPRNIRAPASPWGDYADHKNAPADLVLA